MTHPAFDEARLSRMNDVMRGYVERGQAPGLITLVQRRSATRVNVLGKRALGDAPAMTRDSIFRITSMSKLITAVAAMILIEECKLRLDEPVERLLPELANRRVLKNLNGPVDDTVPAKRSIHVRDLLTFRSGFGMVMASPETCPVLAAAKAAGVNLGPPAPAEMPEPDAWLRKFATLPLMAQPGERWLYQTSAELLSVLIARAADKPFEQFLRERIFEPLAMNDTGFYVAPSQRARFTTGYFTDPKTGALAVADAPDGQWSTPPRFASGADGLVSTVNDMLVFAQLLLNRGVVGKQRILSRPSVELMTTNHLTPDQRAISGLTPGDFDAWGYGFGGGVVMRRDDLFALGTYGWDGGFGTSLRVDFVEQTITLLLTQAAWSSPQPAPMFLDFWTSAYQAFGD